MLKAVDLSRMNMCHQQSIFKMFLKSPFLKMPGQDHLWHRFSLEVQTFKNKQTIAIPPLFFEGDAFSGLVVHSKVLNTAYPTAMA